jgi:hypothetical protein
MVSRRSIGFRNPCGSLTQIVMGQSRFKIVFEKMAEALASGEPTSFEPPVLAYAELDELSELRRLAEEFGAPEAQSYTRT